MPINPAITVPKDCMVCTIRAKAPASSLATPKATNADMTMKCQGPTPP